MVLETDESEQATEPLLADDELSTPYGNRSRNLSFFDMAGLAPDAQFFPMRWSTYFRCLAIGTLFGIAIVALVMSPVWLLFETEL